jgi:hypothetical protein
VLSKGWAWLGMTSIARISHSRSAAFAGQACATAPTSTFLRYFGHQTRCQPMLCIAPAVRPYSESELMQRIRRGATVKHERSTLRLCRTPRFLCQLKQAVPSGHV